MVVCVKHPVQTVGLDQSLAMKVLAGLEHHKTGGGRQLVRPEECCSLVFGLDGEAAT